MKMSNTDRTPQAVTLPTDWAPASWRSRTAMQMPTYPDADALESALANCASCHPW
jgi:3-deoxy-7-phosphoheptulonate synthase